jgi:hypothetical protein
VLFGLAAERSLVAWAARRPGSMRAKLGVRTITRGAGAPQSGQEQGSAALAMGRRAVKTPQFAHS